MQIDITTINPLKDGEYKVEVIVMVKDGKVQSQADMLIMNTEDLQW